LRASKPKGLNRIAKIEGTSSEEFVDALSEQCHGDVFPTKLRPVKIEDENEND
jgi:hypothetical protein